MGPRDFECRFHCHSGVMRPPDHDVTANEKVVCSSSQEEGTCHTYARPHGNAPGLVRRPKQWEESMGNSLYCGLHGKEQVRQGEKG